MFFQLCEGAETVRVGLVLTPIPGKARTKLWNVLICYVVAGDLSFKCLFVCFSGDEQRVKTVWLLAKEDVEWTTNQAKMRWNIWIHSLLRHQHSAIFLLKAVTHSKKKNIFPIRKRRPSPSTKSWPLTTFRYKQAVPSEPHCFLQPVIKKRKCWKTKNVNIKPAEFTLRAPTASQWLHIHRL